MINLHRIDANWIAIDNPYGVDATILANQHVWIDRATYGEIDQFLALANSLREIDSSVALDKVVFSPDLHKGSGIPVGTTAQFKNCVIPKAIGTDIGCGMQLVRIDISPDILSRMELDARFRYRFFEGGRNIARSRNDRIEIFTQQVFSTPYVPEEFLRSSAKTDDEPTRDDQLGSVGGGNHFVELQIVAEILDSSRAYDWGLAKGQVVAMIHTGSVSVGQYVGKQWQETARRLWPKSVKKPTGDFYALLDVENIQAYKNAELAAANFASANRAALREMVIDSIADVAGTKPSYHVIHDSFHNIALDDGLHRKGACSAKANEPVIVPGSMGDSSYLLCGHGNTHALCSACHGAGRKTARSGARNASQELDSIRLITKLDPRRIVRKDIIEDYKKSIAEEAPSCYKDIGPAIDTCRDAQVASPVARFKPILTIKGY